MPEPRQSPASDQARARWRGATQARARWRGAMRAGCWVGALAGLWVALADYGAVWLWLPLWRDRGGLLLRMLGILTPIGAGLGTVVAVLSLGSVVVLRTPHRIALAWAVLTAPLAHMLAVKLCSGGMMSRLAFHDVLEWTLSALLPVFAYAALRVVSALVARVQSGTIGTRRLAAALLVASFALGKLNQTFLPNLYDYLHSGLALLTWGLSAAALGLLWKHEPRLGALRAAASSPKTQSAVVLGLGCTLTFNLVTLDHNLNVRVAMFDPRAASARALLSASNPLLRILERRARQKVKPSIPTARSADTADLPSYQGAHVLLVTIDALRADHLGAYGYARPVSPGLDALARDNLMFRRAYAQAPHSSYSLSSLHASEYLHETVELGRPLPGTTLASVLREHGYHTAAFFTDGVFHTEGHKLARYRDTAFGFALFDHTNREAEDQTDRVLAEVERIREQGEPPSFFWVHYFDVHEPYQETTFGTSDLDRYDSEIKHVDRELTRLLAELDKRLKKPLVIAITADHGEEFREHGGVYHGSTLFDEQVRVPLLFRTPGKEQASIDAPVEVIDVAPTLLGMVGVPAPRSMRGRDLRALVAGHSKDEKPVFSGVLTKRMALRWPFKLIADLRFGLFELYDLRQDQSERRNLARDNPTQLALLQSDVYAWLDSLEQAETSTASAAPSERERALRWGRLGDRRAVKPMAALLLDRAAPVGARVEAGQILARLADESAAPSLVEALSTEPPEVAAEAAIALGRMYDERARSALERLVHTEDPYLRARAAVSLGRLRDVRAVPALIDALWVAPTLYEREEAVRWLGRLRDPRAVEPLISLIPEFGIRYLVAVALGEIGDARAFAALTDMLSWEERTNIRDEVVRGLGLLGDPRANSVLVPLLANEVSLKNTAESLIRLDAPAQGLVGGRDIDPSLSGRGGLYECAAGPLRHDWDYLQRTTCKARSGAQIDLPLHGRAEKFAGGATLVARVRRDDAPEAVELRLSLDEHALPPAQVDANWIDLRFELSPDALREPRVTLHVKSPAEGAVFALDHALLVGKPDALALGASGRTEPAQDAQHPP